MLRGLLAAVLFVALIPLRGLVEIELKVQQVAGRRPLAAETYNLPPPQALRALSFGFNELGADLLWIRTIIYFADHVGSDHDLRYLPQHISNALALDPHFKQVYRFGAAMLMSQHEQTNPDTFAAINLLTRGHTYFPDDWRMPFHIGAYYMSNLRSDDPAERARWRRLGADWVRRAALVGSDIAWLPNLAAKIYSEQGQRDIAIKHLEEIYLVTKDEAMKRQIEGKLHELNATQVTVMLRSAAADLTRAREAEGLAFVPDDLYLLMQLPALEPFSTDGLFRVHAGR